MSVCFGAFACLPAAATNLVTGNGFGFAVVSPETAAVTKFYAHPYSFARPDPAKPLSEGIETTNFLKSLAWSGQGASAEYETESQVIHVRSSDGEGYVFMPFGLRKSALIVDWERSAKAPSGGWTVEWNHPLRSRRVVTVDGREIDVLEFDAVEERLLLIPLSPISAKTCESQLLACSTAWAMVSLEPGDDTEKTVHELFQWQGKLQPRLLAQREITELEQWRVKPPASLTDAKAIRLWRQSEVMLAHGTEPLSLNKPGRNGNGLIVASLPDGVWFTPWVRDMAYATVALARMGHKTKRARRYWHTSMRSPRGRCVMKRPAPTTRSRWSAISVNGKKNPSSPWRATPTSSSTIGAKPSGS